MFIPEKALENIDSEKAAVLPRSQRVKGKTCQVRGANAWSTRVWLVPSGPHYNDVIMGSIASQITSLTIIYSTVYSDADQTKHQSSASMAFVRGIHRRPVNFPHKGPVTRKMFPFDDVIMPALECVGSPVRR